jgi:phosphoadenosine phosphosulfate reductase
VRETLEHVQTLSEKWKPEETLRWAFSTFKNDIAMASAFGAEGLVLIDIATRVNPAMQIFIGDTEFLFPETYDLIDRVERHYGITVERVFSSLTPEQQEREHGPELWTHNPDKCCNIRKIEPLRGKLSTLKAWITSIRRDQTSFRAAAHKVEWDEKFGLVKVNPLADWTHKMVWNYIVGHKVPYNILHDRGYPSIGCTNCTRAVRPGEDPRAGRWSGFQKTECGLHAGPQQEPVPLIHLEVPQELDKSKAPVHASAPDQTVENAG